MPTYLRTIRPAAMVASRYSPTMLPSNSQLKCVIRLLPFFGVLSEGFNPAANRLESSPWKLAERRLLPARTFAASRYHRLLRAECFTASVNAFFSSVPKLILLMPFTMARPQQLIRHA